MKDGVPIGSLSDVPPDSCTPDPNRLLPPPEDVIST